MLRRVLAALRPESRPMVLVVTTRGTVAVPADRLRDYAPGAVRQRPR